MSVFADKDARLVVQEQLVGSARTFHTRRCMDYGTKVVAELTPGKDSQMFEGEVAVFWTLFRKRDKKPDAMPRSCSCLIRPPLRIRSLKPLMPESSWSFASRKEFQ